MIGGAAEEVLASAQITTERVYLLGYVLKGGTTLSSVQFRNGGAGGAVKWADFIKLQTVAGDECVRLTFPTRVEFPKGLYVTLTGTGAVVYVEYRISPTS